VVMWGLPFALWQRVFYGTRAATWIRSGWIRVKADHADDCIGGDVVSCHEDSHVGGSVLREHKEGNYHWPYLAGTIRYPRMTQHVW
jgi:hypothetical protein